MKFSPSTIGFYLPELHGASIPADAIDITDAEHAALIAGQADGAAIEGGANGRPVLVGPSVPSKAEQRASWRATAYLERGAFVRALRSNGILPADEAITAAGGAWPATFASALATLPVDPVDAQIDWAAASGVSRTNPLFLALLGYFAAVNGLSAAQAEAFGDTIFGIPGALLSPD